MATDVPHTTPESRKRKGMRLVVLSVVTRGLVLLLLFFTALNTDYINYKVGYNNARLVGLSSGTTAKIHYQVSDLFYSVADDPVALAQTNAGMTWSIQIFGLRFTDPIAFISVVVKNHSLELGFTLGLIIPLLLALLFGRIFCSYVCPASLLFFSISRIRQYLQKYFYFPDLQPSRGLALGVLMGGLALVLMAGHGIWMFLLPYLGIGQGLFQAVIYGTVSGAVVSVALFSALDLFLGKQFTCRYVCPTGQLLGWVGKKSAFRIQRNEPDCVETCHSCEEVCPMKISPKIDETHNCSLCGECMVVCPAQCLDIKNVFRETQ